MTSRVELIRAAMECEEIAAAYRERARVYRRALQSDAEAEYAEQGTVPKWTVRGLATVTLPVTHDRAAVVDDAAFARSVARLYPTEVQRTVTVRTSFAEVLLGRLEEVRVRRRAAAQEHRLLDPATDKTVRGVTLVPGGETQPLRITPTTQARAEFAEMAAAWVAAHPLPEPPTVPAATDDAA